MHSHLSRRLEYANLRAKIRPYLESWFFAFGKASTFTIVPERKLTRSNSEYVIVDIIYRNIEWWIIIHQFIGTGWVKQATFCPTHSSYIRQPL